jgi:hypothetical protein
MFQITSLIIILLFYQPGTTARYSRHNVKMPLMVKNSCTIKFFNQSNFRGKVIELVKEDIEEDSFKLIHPSKFKHVESLKIFGTCCWEVFR